MLRCFLILSLVLAQQAVLALNLGFLKNAPISKMNADDTSMLSAAIQQALTDNTDNQELSWNNDKTGSNGTVKVLRSYEAHNTNCRTILLYNVSHGESATSQFDFCRSRNGEWKVLK